MVSLAAIELTRWRAFERTQRIELRPLTLFFGWNNSGKSALLRALPILSDSASAQAAAPLNLKGPAARGATFRDLSWRAERKGMKLALEWGGEGGGRYEVELMLDDDRVEQPILRVTRFAWRGTDAPAVEGAWTLVDANGNGAVFNFGSAERPWEEPVRFRGLVPSCRDERIVKVLAPAVRHIQSIDQTVQWLASVRRVPFEPVRVQEAPPIEIAHDGSDVFDALAHAPTVLENVSAWFREHTRRELEMRAVSPGFVQPMFRHIDSTHAQRLADHGEGLLQVLPVLTTVERSRAIHQKDHPAPRMVAIEDPESHLHPHMQLALAKYLTEVVMDDDPPTLVLETHAQLVLQALQLAAVGGTSKRLDPSRVAIYWVEQDGDGASEVTQVQLDEKGELHGWPPGVYADVIDIARDYTSRRWKLSDVVPSRG